MSTNVISQALEIGEAVVAGLQSIEKLSHVGGDRAEAALAAIRGVIHAINEGLSGDLEKSEILEKIDELHHSVAFGDAAAHAELRRRFPPKVV